MTRSSATPRFSHLLLISLFLFGISAPLFGQNEAAYYLDKKGEVYFRFSISEMTDIKTLSRNLSIDNIKNDSVYAYANRTEFNFFSALNIPYVVLPHPGDGNEPMSDNVKDIQDWDTYPTYQGYLDMMYGFASQYPSLCEVVEAGTSIEGRKILFLRISDSVALHEAEPQVMYSSSIHGDETTGYILLLRLADYLLRNYGTLQKATRLVDNLEIWLNPLSNPDGTYNGGNNSVNGATRYNSNFFDLNRNFPDPVEGPYPNGDRQQETTVMMNLAEQNNFILSANFHGGTEVVNYPWDCYTEGPPDYNSHPDFQWFQFISHLYADTCQANSTGGYMSGYIDGITNGGDWYVISGGRQDYFTYFRRGREVTIEISDTKLLPASQLNNLWNYNYRSLLTYLESALYGIHGIVTDMYGNPLRANIEVVNYDEENSDIFSDSTNGFYCRMLFMGTFSLRFTADGYIPRQINNVRSFLFTKTTLNVQLAREQDSIAAPGNLHPSLYVYADSVSLFWKDNSYNETGFIIERKPDEADSLFMPVDTVFANDTTFTDASVSENTAYRYRIFAFNADTTSLYSNECAVVTPPYTQTDNDAVPTDYFVSQNFPNPFNPATTIRYALPEAGNVRLAVYDALGQPVAELVNGFCTAGYHEANFDASHLSSGVYFYRFTAGTFIKVNKMTVIK